MALIEGTLVVGEEAVRQLMMSGDPGVGEPPLGVSVAEASEALSGIRFTGLGRPLSATFIDIRRGKHRQPTLPVHDDREMVVMQRAAAAGKQRCAKFRF